MTILSQNLTQKNVSYMKLLPADGRAFQKGHQANGYHIKGANQDTCPQLHVRGNKNNIRYMYLVIQHCSPFPLNIPFSSCVL